jgi:uncharacterized membrane protein YbaN (DUF454 family)
MAQKQLFVQALSNTGIATEVGIAGISVQSLTAEPAFGLKAAWMFFESQPRNPGEWYRWITPKQGRFF